MGRPQFSTPGNGGSGQILATQDRPEVEYVDTQQSADVAAGERQTTEVYAPTGSVYRVKNFFADIQAVPSATSGTHQLNISTAGNLGALSGRATYDGKLSFLWSYWNKADDLQRPSSEVAQGNAVERLMATENQPIRIVYKNNSDATQTNSRFIDFTVEEVSY